MQRFCLTDRRALRTRKPCTDLAWETDGEHINFTECLPDEDSGIYTVHLSILSKSPTLRVIIEKSLVKWFLLSPDGRHAVYTRYNENDQQEKLFIMNRITNERIRNKKSVFSAKIDKRAVAWSSVDPTRVRFLSNNTLYEWHITENVIQPVFHIDKVYGTAVSFAWSPNDAIMCFSFANTIVCYSTKSNLVLSSLQLDDDEVGCLAFSPNSRHLAICTKKGLTLVWDERSILHGICDPVSFADDACTNTCSISWCADNKHFVTCNGTDKIFITSVEYCTVWQVCTTLGESSNIVVQWSQCMDAILVLKRDSRVFEALILSREHYSCI